VNACVFCEIVAGRAPATVVREWDDALALVPLGPVVDGHTLVIPKQHVADFGETPTCPPPPCGAPPNSPPVTAP
jgi:histidine triad (HIT) family protein